ncbi:MAG: XRE family transcriptional regulator [Clostridia bacterium]|nr:XRE family transcriptional regulator [Clostridia bacterium]
MALSELRHSRDLSQRTLANDLNISQALLSHYENGTREPGLPFVCRVCDYFGVSADYMLGRSFDEHTGINATGGIAELTRALNEIDDSAVRKAALDFVDFAAKKMTLQLTFHEDLSLAEQSAAMAQSELSVVRLRKKQI